MTTVEHTRYPWPSEPRAHRFPDVVQGKRDRLWEPHVAPLNRLVKQINATRGEAAAPWFDPDGGGVRAGVLFLLENPGPRANSERGSGFISADNDDGTAATFFRLRDQAGLSRDRLVAWNIVPWYQPDGGRTSNATRANVRDALPWLARLLALLPDLRVVITMGVWAREGWMYALATDTEIPLLPTLAVPHPSPHNLARRPGDKDVIYTAMQRAAQVVTGLNNA